MKFLHILLLFTISSFAETYISGSVINNSVIGDNNFKNRGSGVIVSKNISTSSFNKIDIDIPAKIDINRAEERNILLKTDNNLINKIKVYVKGTTLFIRTKGSFQSTKDITIVINNPNLKSLIVDGASTINIDGYKEKSISIIVDGSTDIYFKSGNFNTLSLKADGSYDINLLNIEIKNAKIRAEGAGDIKVNVSNYLDIDLEGSVDVKYSGNPKLKKRVKDVADLTHI